MNRQHLLLVDGMALLFRAFFATAVRRQFMINSTGIPTNAVQGYLRHLLTAIEQIRPTHVAVCWDMGGITFRNDIYSGYKADRPAPPEEMIPQFDLAKEATEAFGILNIGVPGYEADDCLGTIANQNKIESDITILTGDKDLLQVIDDDVNVFIIQNGIGNYKKHTKSSFISDYELLPKQLIDVKALMGDTSDGYPGVKGIGEKTALKLIKEFHDIEKLLDNLSSLSPSVQKRIQSDLDMLHLSRKLAEINCDVPFEFDRNETVWNDIPMTANDFVDRYELKIIRNHLLKYNSYIERNVASGSEA